MEITERVALGEPHLLDIVMDPAVRTLPEARWGALLNGLRPWRHQILGRRGGDPALLGASGAPALRLVPRADPGEI